MRITVKQINELISPNGFAVEKKGTKYFLTGGKSQKPVELKGTLKVNYDKILKLCNVKLPVDGELIATEMDSDIVTLFKYAFDIMWCKKDVEASKLLHFKVTNLNGVESALNAKYSMSCKSHKPFYAIWRNLIKYQMHNEIEKGCDTLLEKFKKEMMVKELLRTA